MVIKGKSRTNGRQLAAYLQKLDGNERIQILEHNSPHDTLSETFRDWEVLADGVEGKKYLYHAQINPEARYVLTPEQYERAADVLETELRFTGQPRVIVFHEKDDGRQHVHVVWHRIDAEKMTLLDDGWNYVAHERASLALELEFGHELVPGKHAKRDREQQPEFPRAKYTLDEAQQFERNEIDPEQFKITLAAMYHHSDSGATFKAALEDNGLILARGDSKAFVIVDQEGEVYSLARQLTDVKTRELKQFLKDIPLPNVEQAEAQQDLKKVMDRWKQAETPPPRTDPPEPEQKPEPIGERQKQDAQHMPTRTQPDTPTDPELEKLQAALKERNAKQERELKQRHDREIQQLREQHKTYTDELLEARRRVQQLEFDRFNRKVEEHSDDWVNKFSDILKPEAAKQQRRERQRQIDEMTTRHRIERETLLETRKLQRDAAIEEIKHRHGQEVLEQDKRNKAELARYQQEQADARRILKDLEEQQKQAHKKNPDEPGPPKYSL